MYELSDYLAVRVGFYEVDSRVNVDGDLDLNYKPYLIVEQVSSKNGSPKRHLLAEKMLSSRDFNFAEQDSYLLK